MAAIDHRRALTFLFTRGDWARSLLFVVVGLLVPLIGQLAVSGYQAVIAEHIGRRGDRDWPAFDPQRLADYLLRGLRLFLLTTVMGLLLAPIGFLVLFCTIGLAVVVPVAIAGDSAAAVPLALLVAIPGSLLFTAVIYGALALFTPLWLQAGINPDLGGALDLDFLRDFVRRVGRELLLGHLVLLLLTLALFLAGLLACFVGIFPSLALVMLVQAHVYGQLYALYLARGGRPIPAAAS